MSLILPDSVRANMEREAMVDHATSHAAVFNRALRGIDRRLSLVFANEKCSAPGLTPGRFHVRMRNERGGPDLYMPLETEGGGFREPGSGDLLRLQQSDLHNDRVMREFRRADEVRQADVERRKMALRLERREEMAARVKAYDSPGVSFDVGAGWSYRAAGGADKRRRESR